MAPNVKPEISSSDPNGSQPPEDGYVDSATAWLLFEVAGKGFALPADDVFRTAPLPKCHRVPHRNLPVEGIVNVLNELIPCVSFAQLLNLSSDPDAKWMVVLEKGTLKVACTIHRTLGVEKIPRRLWRPMRDLPGSIHESVDAFADYKGRVYFRLESETLARILRTVLQ